MRTPIIVAVAQPLTVSGDLAANAKRHADAIVAAGADVVVFPELSLTGYELDGPTLAEAGRWAPPLVEACRSAGSLALAGALVATGHGGKNIATLAIDGDGPRLVYRKMWLGGAEPAHVDAGSEPAVIERAGWRLGLAICKDTGVPAHAAATIALGCDLYVAGALETIDDADVQPARARSIARRHGVWVAVASFAGSTGGGYDDAAGGSGIWRPDGTEVARAGSAAGEVVRATIPDTSPPRRAERTVGGR